ncbi:MAG: amino acid transporter [Hyphomicrobiales bacterium]|nr:amino acid transporter [Hyphomicrobiales bacterium]
MASLIPPALSGFALGGSLIIAIGAQNAFILRMGLNRQHVFVLCLICAACDAVLIAAGVTGLGAFVDTNPQLLKYISIGGGLFLLVYAIFAIRRMIFPQAMESRSELSISIAKAISICLAFTFLNPHVYLDTVVLVGALAAAWQGQERLIFAAGAIAASFVWFFALGYGARLLGPLFEKQISWQILDALIAIVMAWLGISIFISAF